MAQSINQVTLMGNLGRDPEIRTFANGGKVANLRLATTKFWTDGQGERRSRTEWHSVSIFDTRLVGLAEKYLKKGTKVYLKGQLETRKWQDRDGQDRYATEVVMRPYRSEMTIVESKAQSEARAAQTTNAAPAPAEA